MSQFAATLDLSALDGTNGFRIYSSTDYDYSGFSVSSAGDVNGDGFADLIIGAPYNGSTYVVFGGDAALAALDLADGSTDGAIDLSELDGTNGFKIASNAPFLGISVSSGDINGDHLSDVLIGGAGFTLALFGNSGPFQAVYDDSDISTIDGTQGYVLVDTFGGGFGNAVSAGDINGDGFDDIIVGAPYEFGSYGATFIIFGGAANLAALDAADGSADGFIDPFAIDGTTGFAVVAPYSAGFSARAAGDINGDGFGDLLVGSYYGEDGAYLVFGKGTPFGNVAIDATNLHGHQGYAFGGPDPGDNTGFSVGAAGDINGDGFADFVMGAPHASVADDYDGVSYVVFGGRSALVHLDKADGVKDNHIDLTLLDGSNGFRIVGAEGYDASGWSVSSAGDVNGDGFADLIVGAPYSGFYTGAAYVVFGAAGGFGAELDLADIDGNNGFKLTGETGGDVAGWSVNAAGDVNGDGFADLVVGAYYSSVGGTQAGATYVVYGHMPDEAVTREGTKIANTIHGSNFDDVLTGLGGSDTLIGHDGNDILHGSGGDDILIGGGGADNLGGKVGADTFVYGEASDSAGASFDVIWGLDGTEDQFDLWFTVTGLDVAVTANLNQLPSALDATHLQADHAALVEAPNGREFLVIDANGTAGYQDGADLLIELKDAVNTSSIDVSSFV